MDTPEAPSVDGTMPTGGPNEVKRRDFLFIATGAVAGIGALYAAWPFIDQMEPSAQALAEGMPITVNISSVAPGQQIEVQWRSKPIFIVNRTPAALKELKLPSVLNRLRDPHSEEMQQPAYADNWSRSIKPEYLVVVGICTHLGCIPKFKPQIGDPTLAPNWPGGYFCPCHGSRYDMAGRVFQGVPAPLNLPVPPYHFKDDTHVVIGEDPKGSTFALSEVEQI